MKMLRTLFVASSVLALSAATLSAQDTQVTCKDGAKSKGGRGACSGHGGIAAAAKADVKTDKIEKTAATAEKKIDKTAAAADKKIEKTADKAEAKTEAKTEKTAEAKVAKKHHAKGKAKAKA